VITRRLIQITFRDRRGDVDHGGTATIISKYRYRLSPAVPAKWIARQVRRVLGSQYAE
jgi:hypothetical protein